MLINRKKEGFGPSGEKDPVSLVIPLNIHIWLKREGEPCSGQSVCNITQWWHFQLIKSLAGHRAIKVSVCLRNLLWLRWTNEWMAFLSCLYISIIIKLNVTCRAAHGSPFEMHYDGFSKWFMEIGTQGLTLKQKCHSFESFCQETLFTERRKYRS